MEPDLRRRNANVSALNQVKARHSDQLWRAIRKERNSSCGEWLVISKTFAPLRRCGKANHEKRTKAHHRRELEDEQNGGWGARSGSWVQARTGGRQGGGHG